MEDITLNQLLVDLHDQYIDDREGLNEGEFTTSMYADANNITMDIAYRQLRMLAEKGVLCMSQEVPRIVNGKRTTIIWQVNTSNSSSR